MQPMQAAAIADASFMQAAKSKCVKTPSGKNTVKKTQYTSCLTVPVLSSSILINCYIFTARHFHCSPTGVSIKKSLSTTAVRHTTRCSLLLNARNHAFE